MAQKSNNENRLRLNWILHLFLLVPSRVFDLMAHFHLWVDDNFSCLNESSTKKTKAPERKGKPQVTLTRHQTIACSFPHFIINGKWLESRRTVNRKRRWKLTIKDCKLSFSWSSRWMFAQGFFFTLQHFWNGLINEARYELKWAYVNNVLVGFRTFI